MSGRKMYSMELKLEIVQRYLKGDISIKQLADEYHISSKACIQKWLALYREHGEALLLSDSREGFYVIGGSQSLRRRTNRLPLWWHPYNYFTIL